MDLEKVLNEKENEYMKIENEFCLAVNEDLKNAERLLAVMNTYKIERGIKNTISFGRKSRR